MIFTARIGEKVKGIIINITVKDNKNHVLSPTWNMVMKLKNGSQSWEEYKEDYFILLSERMIYGRSGEVMEIVEQAKKEDIFLACYCASASRCHRSLAKEFLNRFLEEEE